MSDFIEIIKFHFNSSEEDVFGNIIPLTRYKMKLKNLLLQKISAKVNQQTNVGNK